MIAPKWQAIAWLFMQTLRPHTCFSHCPLAFCAQELVGDGVAAVRSLLAYPLADTVASEESKPVMEDNFKEVSV